MIESINHVTLAVRDLNESFNFYINVLGCLPLARWEKGIYLPAAGSPG